MKYSLMDADTNMGSETSVNVQNHWNVNGLSAIFVEIMVWKCMC